MDYRSHCDQLAREGARVVELARRADVDLAVPGCPGWSVGDLLAHVDFVQRRTRYWVQVRAPARISAREMDLPQGAVDAAWLAEGLEELLVTLRASDPDAPMWAWGEDQHVRYWARRLLHETLVHRVDLEDALGLAVTIDPEVASDAIDEFLGNVASAGEFSPAVANLVGEGDVVEFRVEGGTAWSVRLDPDGFRFVSDPPAPDASLVAEATELLLVIYGRRSLDSHACRVAGRRELLERWIENSALL
jgi:uncharacterized protein (TIGR03083 family)